MNYFLYGASVQGIQDFIFQTSKLKEIGGGSELVEQICTSKFLKEADIDDKDENIIINAAGNIKYIFDDEHKCRDLVRKFPKTIAEFAPGITISQAVVKFGKTEKLSDAINKLEDSLKAQRNKVQNPLETGFMGLERARRTGGVGVKYLENEVIDASIEAKLYEFDSARKEGNFVRSANDKSVVFSNLYQKFFGEDLKVDQIPFDINQISENSSIRKQNGSDSSIDSKSNNLFNPWIAVIHADGNGLGKLVQQLGRKLKEKDTEVAKKALSDFSKKLDEATQMAAAIAFEKLNLEIPVGEKYPLRPVILGGDDITMIIRADLAFDFTVNFLDEFKEQTEDKLSFLSKNLGLTDFEKGLTACAGIAYIKYSYPIHYGLHLAEELTKKAKRVSKSIVGDNELAPSSLSFYKVHSSFIEDLSEIEEKTLTAGNLSFDYGPYFLEETRSLPTVKNLTGFIEVLEEQKDDKLKGVSKLRQWVSELYKDKSTAEFMKKRMKVVNDKFYDKMELDNAIVEGKIVVTEKAVFVNGKAIAIEGKTITVDEKTIAGNKDIIVMDAKTIKVDEEIIEVKEKTIIYDVLQLFSFL